MSEWEEIRIGIYENYDTKERVEVEVVDYGGWDYERLEIEGINTLWDARALVPPPKKGFVMFADSATDHNVPYLLELGVKPEQIIITEHPMNQAVWRNDE